MAMESVARDIEENYGAMSTVVPIVETRIGANLEGISHHHELCQYLGTQDGRKGRDELV